MELQVHADQEELDTLFPDLAEPDSLYNCGKDSPTLKGKQLHDPHCEPSDLTTLHHNPALHKAPQGQSTLRSERDIDHANSLVLLNRCYKGNSINLQGKRKRRRRPHRRRQPKTTTSRISGSDRQTEIRPLLASRVFPTRSFISKFRPPRPLARGDLASAPTGVERRALTASAETRPVRPETRPVTRPASLLSRPLSRPPLLPPKCPKPGQSSRYQSRPRYLSGQRSRHSS